MPTEEMEGYVCAISGQPLDDESLIIEDADEDDDLGSLPIGWSAITIRTRRPNPAWDDIQATKSALVEQQLAQVPEAQREEARRFAEVVVDANFAALESRTERFDVVEHTVNVSPQQRSHILELFGIKEEPEEQE